MNTSGSILLVDDEPAFLHANQRMLDREGYACQTAQQVDDALALLRDNDYDLLIADIKMPGNPDLRLIREALKLAPAMPVILVTGCPAVDSAQLAIQLPVLAYLTKPLDFDQLLIHVGKAMTHSLMHQTLTRTRLDLQHCLDEVQHLQASLSIAQKVGEPESSADFWNTVVQQLLRCVQRLEQSRPTPSTRHALPRNPHFANPRQQTALHAAVEDAVDVIERTRHSFKSKELADLRCRLQRVLKKTRKSAANHGTQAMFE